MYKGSTRTLNLKLRVQILFVTASTRAFLNQTSRLVNRSSPFNEILQFAKVPAALSAASFLALGPGAR
jgi:hypothetical protein